MFPGDDATKTAKRLCDAGALRGGDGKNLVRKAPRRLVPRERVYVLSLRRLGIETAAETPAPSNLGTASMKKSG